MSDQVLNLTRKGIWGLTALSVTSCLIRNDYNVLFCFLILIILDRYYEENKKVFTKVIIQVLCILSAVDIVWFIIIIPYWNSDIPNDYWQSLSGMHNFILIISFLELIVKAVIVGYLVMDYKKNFGDDLYDMTNINYSTNQAINKNPIDDNSKHMNTQQNLNQ